MDIINLFRADPTNAGDWWSPPIRYFRFRDAKGLEILQCDRLPNTEAIFIVGGGGLGRPYFRKSLDWLTRPDRRYTLISWGAGCDTLEDRTSAVDAPADPLGGYFSGFDINGLRIYPASRSHRWVPCPSCMWKGFDQYRSAAPSEEMGVYQHKDVPIRLEGIDGLPVLTNRGDSIEEKVAYLSRFRTVVTNSYHGVYWATLINRKVICLPFKSGLYTFRHRPAYARKSIAEARMGDIDSHPRSLEECREANIDFYHFLVKRHGL